MQKQPPSLPRILVAVGFALSAFSLILFLWVAFGGPVPLKPESYRITAYFPEATQLAQQSDVRIGGVSVGKVEQIKLAPPSERVNGKDTTEAVIQISPQYAPISSDAKAILRQKTLLGETYVELTSGTNPNGTPKPVALGPSAQMADASSSDSSRLHSIPEGGTLGVSQTQEATQIDEIFNALDKRTRTAFERWLQNAQVAIKGRGLDLNDAFGNLGPFAADASRLLQILHRQQSSVQGLVRDTGTVFSALSAQDSELAGAIRGSDTTFKALASESENLRRTFAVFPTFEQQTKATLASLDSFRQTTYPLLRRLRGVAGDVSPTLRSVRHLSPHLRSLFANLRPLIRAARPGFPALAHFLGGLRPALAAFDPVLANINPIVRFLKFERPTVSDFFSEALSATAAGHLQPSSYSQPNSTGHVLRVTAWFSPETLGIERRRVPTNRGNSYFLAHALGSFRAASHGETGPMFDCNPSIGTPGANAKGELKATDSTPGCTVQKPFPQAFGGTAFPELYPDRRP